jgi:hypothetical protein
MEANSAGKPKYGGQRKMGQVLGSFVLLDFTMFGPVLACAPFKTYEPFISLIFDFFSGSGEPRITEFADSESVGTGARLYIYIYISLYASDI